MTVFDRMKQKKKEEYTLGELMLAYACGYGLTIGCGVLIVIGVILGIPLVGSGIGNVTWSQLIFFECVNVFLLFFGAGVSGYLDMWRW